MDEVQHVCPDTCTSQVGTSTSCRLSNHSVAFPRRLNKSGFQCEVDGNTVVWLLLYMTLFFFFLPEVQDFLTIYGRRIFMPDGWLPCVSLYSILPGNTIYWLSSGVHDVLLLLPKWVSTFLIFCALAKLVHHIVWPNYGDLSKMVHSFLLKGKVGHDPMVCV